jgi:hypothetical protein
MKIGNKRASVCFKCASLGQRLKAARPLVRARTRAGPRARSVPPRAPPATGRDRGLYFLLSSFRKKFMHAKLGTALRFRMDSKILRIPLLLG